MIQITSRIQQQQDLGQDRIAVVHHDNSTTVVLADGVGGVSGGAEAADYVVTNLGAVAFPQIPVVLMDEVLGIDGELIQTPHLGESTLVLVTFEAGQFTGAVVGDSEVYQYSDGELVNAVPHKELRPVLGSTGCYPATFQGTLDTGRILICSDGLWKYCSRAKITSILEEPDLDKTADMLLSSVRLTSGALQDDVSLVLVE